MLIQPRVIDDFKTERKDLMPALPVVYRLVPILFYLSLLFLVVVGATAVWAARAASQRYEALVTQTTLLQQDIAATKSSRSELEAKIREATDMENWVLASMPLQPLLVGIVRSIEPGSTLVDLSLERDAESPSQLKLALTLNAESDAQIEKTLAAIRGLNYREFSPTQSTIRGNYEYRASLLWTNPGAQSQTPREREAAPEDR
jgi:hypothetical protein